MELNPTASGTPDADQPLVSVIMPSLNQAGYAEDAIRSVLDQSYPHIELLVVDGGSTDGSLEIFERYADRIRYLVSRPDHGQAEAINEGLAQAGGKYIAWLNTDDLYLPGCIAAGVDALERNPSAGLAYGRVVVIDSAGAEIGEFTHPPFDFIELLSCRQVIPQQASLFRRTALDSVGWLDESMHFALDHDLFIRLAYAFPVCPYDTLSATYRISDANKGALRHSAWADELIRSAEKCFAAHPADTSLAAVRCRVMADVYFDAACHLLDGRQYQPARALIRRSAGQNRRMFTRPRFWLHLMRTFIGRPGNALYASAKLTLARLGLLDPRRDWWTALALRAQKSTPKD